MDTKTFYLDGIEMTWDDQDDNPSITLTYDRYRHARLSGVTYEMTTWEKLQAAFEQLLTFKATEMKNRDRNNMLVRVRNNMCARFNGAFELPNGTFTYTINGDIITIFNSEGVRCNGMSYFKFSKKIQEQQR